MSSYIFCSLCLPFHPLPSPKREVKKNKLYSHTERGWESERERERRETDKALHTQRGGGERKCTYTGTVSDLKRAASVPSIPLHEHMREWALNAGVSLLFSWSQLLAVQGQHLAALNVIPVFTGPPFFLGKREWSFMTLEHKPATSSLRRPKQ